VGDLDNK
jgi:hypothetical protein